MTDEGKESGPSSGFHLTRRQLLKLGTGVAITALIERSPIGKIAEYLVSLGLQEEGNTKQRLNVFNKVRHEASLDPNQENRELALAWLKANLAEFYFESTNHKLATRLVRHFLYGQGESIDISRLYVESIFSFNRRGKGYTGVDLSSLGPITKDEVVAEFISETINRNLSYPEVRSSMQITPALDQLRVPREDLQEQIKLRTLEAISKPWIGTA